MEEAGRARAGMPSRQLRSWGAVTAACQPGLGDSGEQDSWQKGTWTLQGLRLRAPCPVLGQLTAPSPQEPRGSSRRPLPV